MQAPAIIDHNPTSLAPVQKHNSSLMVPKAWYESPDSMLNSLGLGYKAKPSTLTYETLYNMAKRNHIVNIVHKTIKSSVADFCRRPRNKWDIGFRIRHNYLKDWELKPRHHKKIEDLTKWFEHCGDEYHPERPGLRKFIDLITEDRLIFAQMTAELVTRRDGKLHSMWYVPAMSMRLATPPNMKGTPASAKELMNLPRYIQVHNNRVLTSWTEDQILWEVANPRNTLWGGFGYGTSELEYLIIAITAELWAEEFNVNNFKQGSSIKGIFNIKGNVDPEKMEDFRRHWMMQVAGVHNAWRQAFLNAEGLDFIPLNLSNQEMGFEDWIYYLIHIICLMYQIHPSTCGFAPKSGGGLASAGRSAEQYDRMKKDRSKFLRPLLQLIEEMFNSPKVMGRLDPDYRFEWQGIDKKDEEKDIENRNKELQFFKTVNEHRKESGLDQREGWDVPLNPVLIAHLNQQEAMKLQREQFDYTKEQAAIAAEKAPEAFLTGQETSDADHQSNSSEKGVSEPPEGSSSGRTQAQMFADGNQLGSGSKGDATKKSFHRGMRLTEPDVELLIKSGGYDVV